MAMVSLPCLPNLMLDDAESPTEAIPDEYERRKEFPMVGWWTRRLSKRVYGTVVVSIWLDGVEVKVAVIWIEVGCKEALFCNLVR